MQFIKTRAEIIDDLRVMLARDPTEAEIVREIERVMRDWRASHERKTTVHTADDGKRP